MKEGGGPKAEQIVLIFLSQLGGGEYGVNQFRTKSPNFVFFIKGVPKTFLMIHFLGGPTKDVIILDASGELLTIKI